MRLMMVSGDRQVTIGETGPFFPMLREFSTYFERIDVLCPRPDRTPTVRVIHDNVHFHPASCGRAGMVRYIAERGAELIAEHQHGLIISHDYGWFYNGLGSARLSRATGVPYLSEIHHVPGHPVAADLRERFDKRVARRYVRWARARAEAFRVVNSVEMPTLLESWGVPRDQIVVLPSLYIDFDVFRPEPVEVERDVVFVGRMVNNKGVERLVDALTKLDREGLELTALLIGKGPRLAALRERVSRAGLADRITFEEWVDSPQDLAQRYRSSRVLVCASTCEGGPRVTVEAMACGTPVVSTPVGMMRELLVNGENGRTCGFDVESLATAIRAVLSDEPRRLAMGARGPGDVARFEYAAVLRGYAEGVQRIAEAAAR